MSEEEQLKIKPKGKKPGIGLIEKAEDIEPEFLKQIEKRKQKKANK